MELILDIRAQARTQKDWATSDKIRDALATVGIAVKDGKEGASWAKSDS
jgi:cysteinyl-tRNA synthetase